MFKKTADIEPVRVYATNTAVDELKKELQLRQARRGDVFCKDASHFSFPSDFDFDLDNFLYYRARAMTADIPNANHDLFPHAELKKSYHTFIGKGIYFNHNSDNPQNACGIILDAMYTPVLFDNDNYGDKYIEILGAIDRKLANARYPGLVKDIESGRITATSMGTLAEKAQCSLCGKIASNTQELCHHVKPGSPLFCKGQKIDGKLVYESNFGLHMIEDSVVYLPADNTAHMLEIYASADWGTKLAELFHRYARDVHKISLKEPALLLNTFKSTGGFIVMANDKEDTPTELPEVPAAPVESKEPAAAKPADKKKPEMSYDTAVSDVASSASDAGLKIVEDARKRITSEEARKIFTPVNAEIDRRLRPQIAKAVQEERTKALRELEKIYPGITEAVETAQPLPAHEPLVQEPPAEKTANIQPKFVAITESFNNWSDDDKKKLTAAVQSGGTWKFIAEVKKPE